MKLWDIGKKLTLYCVDRIVMRQRHFAWAFMEERKSDMNYRKLGNQQNTHWTSKSYTGLLPRTARSTVLDS